MSFKGWILDPFTLLLVAAGMGLGLVLVTLLWNNIQPQFTGIIKNNTNNNVTQANLLTNFGNAFFHKTFDVIIFFFYMLGNIIALYAAIRLGADEDTIGLGLITLILVTIISFPLSNVFHALFTFAPLVSASVSYPLLLFIVNWLPVLNIFFTVTYLVILVVHPRIGGGSVVTG